MRRKITKHYQDPVDVIWLHAARQCGMEVVRNPEVFATWDGHGVLKIGTPETLDEDDSLAQLILHEICHALVAGPAAIGQEDWGLDYDDANHQIFEQATLRLQAALADQFGLRRFFASTTDFREYFDTLPADPLLDDSDPAAALAILAMDRATNGPWAGPLSDALGRTAIIANVVKEQADENSIWHRN